MDKTVSSSLIDCLSLHLLSSSTGRKCYRNKICTTKGNLLLVWSHEVWDYSILMSLKYVLSHIVDLVLCSRENSLPSSEFACHMSCSLIRFLM